MRQFELRRGNYEAFVSREPQVLTFGPAGTGKSLAWLAKIAYNADKYPKCRQLICRKSRSSLTETGLVSFERDILESNSPLLHPPNLRRVRQSYHHPNGSEIIAGGLDNAEKILSSEYDLIYCQEASELELEEWETLIGRLRSGVMPYQQICGDCNPTFPHHWLYKRYQSGLLKLIPTYHKDNPRYYQKIGGKWTWTDDGESYLAKLNLLTGFRRKRFLEGVWAAAEGLVYEGFGPHNLKERGWTPPKEWVRYHSVDFGYVNPLVYQFWAEDGDGTLYLYREIYKTGMLVEDLAKQIADWVRTGTEPRPTAVLGDHDAEDRATFERHSGLRVYAADKTKKAGIQDVAKRLECQPNGKPRLYLVSGANAKPDNSLSAAGKPTCTEEEFAGYVWHPDGKDEPVKENDHGMDALRYLVRHRDGGRKLLWGAR